MPAVRRGVVRQIRSQLPIIARMGDSDHETRQKYQASEILQNGIQLGDKRGVA